MSREQSCGSGGCSPRDLRRAPASGEVVNRPCCGGKDLGPITDDEGPSEADLQRFGDVTRNCPECKTELYDEVEMCYKCGHALSAGSTRPVPKWVFVGVGAVLAAFMFTLLIW